MRCSIALGGSAVFASLVVSDLGSVRLAMPADGSCAVCFGLDLGLGGWRLGVGLAVGLGVRRGVADDCGGGGGDCRGGGDGGGGVGGGNPSGVPVDGGDGIVVYC